MNNEFIHDYIAKSKALLVEMHALRDELVALNSYEEEMEKVDKQILFVESCIAKAMGDLKNL